jgi:hypothetical protein
MTKPTHPLTPPPKLVREWLGTYFGTTIAGEVSEVDLALATKAAQWGADKELEACCVQLGYSLTQYLRAARRPKPPSLKEQALRELGGLEKRCDLQCNLAAIRRALEALDD